MASKNRDYLLNRKSEKLVLTGDSLYTKRCLTIIIYGPLVRENGLFKHEELSKESLPSRTNVFDKG